MKIALFTPLNPVRSGIADYSEEMLLELKRHVDIDLYIDPGYSPSNQRIVDEFTIHPFDASRFDPSAYDEIVYHLGNSHSAHGYAYDALKRFPGIVVLHDYVFQGFYAEMLQASRDPKRYLDLLRRVYPGQGDRLARLISERLPYPIWESELALEFPLNEEIIGLAKGLIVHSDFVRRRVRSKYTLPVVTIPHHGHVLKPYGREQARKELGFSASDIVVCSTGYVTKNKRYQSIIPALSELAEPRLKYIIVGRDEANFLKVLCQDSRLTVVRKGFATLEELEKCLVAADIGINLRYPTMGENSGSLLRMMSYKKPVLVSDAGSYREFPDHSLIKISGDVDEQVMIKRFVQELIKDKEFRLSLGREAGRYAATECGIARCSREYIRFIHQLAKKNQPRRK